MNAISIQYIGLLWSFCKVDLHLFARFKIVAVAAGLSTMINTGTWQIRVWPVLGTQTMMSPARPQVKKRLPGINQQKAAGVWLRDKVGSNPWRQVLLAHKFPYKRKVWANNLLALHPTTSLPKSTNNFPAKQSPPLTIRTHQNVQRFLSTSARLQPFLQPQVWLKKWLSTISIAIKICTSCRRNTKTWM